MKKGIYGFAAAGVSSLVAMSAIVYKRQHDKQVAKHQLDSTDVDTSKDKDLDSHDVKPARDFNVAKFAEIQRQHQRDHKNINHITHRRQPISTVLQKRYKHM